MTSSYPTSGTSAVAYGQATVTPRCLARELGHDDGGVAIRNFIRFPDDGRGAFVMGVLDPWELTAAQADRVRDRFLF